MVGIEAMELRAQHRGVVGLQVVVEVLLLGAVSKSNSLRVSF